VLWTSEANRRDIRSIADLRLVSPSGAVVLLSDVADVVETPGPNQINRENVQRRIVVACNVQGRDLGSTVNDIRKSVAMDVTFPEGYAITYGGQFESQQRATRLLLILGMFSLAGMFAVLYMLFKSPVLTIHLMLGVPFAFVGGVVALLIAREPFSVASLVGFISLAGIGVRDGILMTTTYIHLMTDEGMAFGRKMVVRGSQLRVAPVLMTSFTTGLAVIPLLLSRGEAGKEILYPVALVVLGGITTSTLLDIAIRPTIFLNFGRKAATRVVEAILQSRRPSPGDVEGKDTADPSSGNDNKIPGQDGSPSISSDLPAEPIPPQNEGKG
jgi:Cu/Ag efflux pump CusA